MELGGSNQGHVPTCFAMDMSKDFLPMSVFSNTIQGTNHIFSVFLFHISIHPFQYCRKDCCRGKNIEQV